MINLSNQPFLQSLQQIADKTGNSFDYETVLHEQQDSFKEYVQQCFNSGVAAPKRFQFLKTADNKLCRIHLEYADKIKEADVEIYRLWVMLIDDARSFIAIGIDTLRFQQKCPAHMLVEEQPAGSFPLCNWTAQRSDLMEAIVALFLMDVIRLKDGSRPSFALFAKEIGGIFGITFINPHAEMKKIFNRKKNLTPFLSSMIAVLKEKFDELNL